MTQAERCKRWRDSHPEYRSKRAKQSKASYHKHKEAINARRRMRWRSEDPNDKNTKSRSFRYKWQYGITLEQYNAMFEAQKGKCALCHKSHDSSQGGRLCIDHDHKTGKVRGLLCRRCNAFLEREESHPGWLVKAVAYLAGFKP